MLKDFRAMTWRQRAVFIALATVTVALYTGALHLAGWLADRRTGGINAAGQYGFGMGFFYALLTVWVFVPALWAIHRRLGGKDRAPATPAAE